MDPDNTNGFHNYLTPIDFLFRDIEHTYHDLYVCFRLIISLCILRISLHLKLRFLRKDYMKPSIQAFFYSNK